MFAVAMEVEHYVNAGHIEEPHFFDYGQVANDQLRDTLIQATGYLVTYDRLLWPLTGSNARALAKEIGAVPYEMREDFKRVRTYGALPFYYLPLEPEFGKSIYHGSIDVILAAVAFHQTMKTKKESIERELGTIRPGMPAYINATIADLGGHPLGERFIELSGVYYNPQTLTPTEELLMAHYTAEREMIAHLTVPQRKPFAVAPRRETRIW